MKSLVTIACLLASLLVGRSFSVYAQGQLPVPPVPARPAVRPLTRYLAATLHLTPEQATAVQQALRAEVPRPLVPEQLAQSLTPVLSPEAQERLQTLQANADSYRTLYYLAARH